MHRRIYVNPLPDCFNTRWAVHSGVALPRDVIDEVLDKELDAEEARRTAGHPQDVKSGVTLTAHEAGSPTTLPGQSTSGAKWAEPNSNYRTTVKILDRHQVEKGAATALLGLRDPT